MQMKKMIQDKIQEEEAAQKAEMNEYNLK